MEEEVIERLAGWSRGKAQFPHKIQIYPTNECNLRCIFCYQQLKEYDLSDIVPKRRWLDIIEEICKLDTKEILISGGGEPLCAPNLTLGIMQIIKHYKLQGRIITNGTLWTEDQIKDTIKLGWDHIMFSIDGANAETHDFLRGVKGAFNKTIKNIKLFTEHKKKLKKEKPFLEFTTVLNLHNYKEVPSLVKLASELGIKSISVEPVCINNPSVEKIKLNKLQRRLFQKKIIPHAQELAEKLGVRTNFSIVAKLEFEKTGELKDTIKDRKLNETKKNNIKVKDKKAKDFFNMPCYEPWLWPKIEANGEVWPCSTVPIKIENIKDKSFKEIWFGKEFTNFRKRIMNHDLPEGCENCVSTHLPINKEIREKLKSI